MAFPVEGWSPPTALIRFQNKREAVEAVKMLQKWKPPGSKSNLLYIYVTHLYKTSRRNHKLSFSYVQKEEKMGLIWCKKHLFVTIS